MNKYKKLLGKRIRQIRRKRELSQEQFAESIGIDPNSVSRIECGIYYPSMDTLEKISAALKVEMRDLFIFSNRESIEEMRAYLIQAASEAGIEQLREMVRAVKKIANK